MRATLTRVAGGAALRAESIEGECASYPELGARFLLIAPALHPADDADMRLVETSPVAAVWRSSGSGHFFETESGSRYHLKVMP